MKKIYEILALHSMFLSSNVPEMTSGITQPKSGRSFTKTRLTKKQAKARKANKAARAARKQQRKKH